ncbi:MAG: CinA family protein [Candidatus Omnitrophica bacterium]|nr:CinA family protein [Candidatus Omnitrophota bacterium]
MSTEMKVAEKLVHRKKTLVLAESCSGGLLSHRLTNIPGSSQFFLGGVIVYSNESKTKLLKIPSTLIREKGAVSSDVAILMAKNVRKLFHADYGVSITGIAGPSGGTKSKPVGLIFIAISSLHETFCVQFQFKTDRESNKRQAVHQALKLLNEVIC